MIRPWLRTPETLFAILTFKQTLLKIHQCRYIYLLIYIILRFLLVKEVKREGQSMKHWILPFNLTGILLCWIFLWNYCERDIPSWTISGRRWGDIHRHKLNLTRNTKGNRKFSLLLSQEKTAQLTHTRYTRLLSILIAETAENCLHPCCILSFSHSFQTRFKAHTKHILKHSFIQRWKWCDKLWHLQ